MSKAVPPIARDLRGRLIVSCQAPDGDAFRDPDSMARFARAAVEGGAAGIRANGVEHVRAIRQAVGVPIIGISKVMQDDGRVLITPTFEAARELVEAGADLIALDCTVRGQRFGAVERLQRIRRDLNVPVLADIATLEEALAAERAGADMILTTMRGYTPETEHVRGFEPEFVRRLVESVSVPVIAEGRIDTPGQARAALDAGAFAVVVGTAITRPPVLTERFVRALDGAAGGASGARVAAIEPAAALPVRATRMLLRSTSAGPTRSPALFPRRASCSVPRRSQHLLADGLCYWIT
jgi:putative N-acetylmannosamine-6-phosphate epimerase